MQNPSGKHDGIGERAANIDAHGNRVGLHAVPAYHSSDSTHATGEPLHTRALSIGLLLIVPSVALANAPNHDLRLGPRVVAPVAGGAPGASPDAWSARGAIAPRLVGGRWRVVSNTTLLSPPVEIPRGGAAVAVRHRAIAGAPVIDVGVAGGRRSTLEPARRERLSWVWLSATASGGERVEFNPTAALGRSVDVGRIGPVALPVPGWSVTQGAPRLSRAGGRRVLVARERVRLLSRVFTLGPGAARLDVEARGSGSVVVSAGKRRVTRPLGASWRRVSLPASGLPRRVRLSIEARPGARDAQLRLIGRVVRRTSMRGLARAPGGSVRGRIVPRGGGLSVEVRDEAGRVVDRGRTDKDGRFRLDAPAGRMRVVTPGDVARLRGSWNLR